MPVILDEKGRPMGFVCGRGKARVKRCTYCAVEARLLCDYPVGPRGKTCDRPICRGCSRHIEPDTDLCKEHAPMWGDPTARVPAPTAPRVVRRGHPGAVYVGRPTKWGNPFRLGDGDDRAEVVARYRAWLQRQPALLAALPELRGRDLACYCAPLACHADVLLELANQ